MRTVAALCRELLPDRRADGDLLAAFTSERSEVPFAELVRRHGPLVWGTCRRLLPDPADAEDAFQATFLVLVRQAGRLKARDTVGPWLHRVAVLTARNVRRKNARRLVRQRELPDELPASSPDSDLRADIDAALLALPARLRDPIILCHLQGFTRREAAERLGCPEGTLSSWLDRGLAKLRVRLRDLDPLKALSVPLVAVPLALTANTTKAAVASGVAAATIPPAVSSIVEGVLHMLWIKKATAATFALCAVFALGVGVGLGTRPGSIGVAAEDGPPKPGAVPEADRKAVAELTERIRVAEKKQLVRKGLLQLTSDKLDLTRQLDPKAKPTPEELEALRKLQGDLDARDAELKTLRSELAKLKGDGARPAVRVGTAETELAKLEDLEAQLAQLEAERAKLRAQTDATARRLAETEIRLHALRHAVELGRAKPNKTAAAAAGYVELTVSAKGNAPEFVIREVSAGATGKKVLGPITTADPAALAVLLKRAKADPNGPQEARVQSIGNPPANLIFEAAEACEAAGFKSTSIKAEVTGPGTLKIEELWQGDERKKREEAYKQRLIEQAKMVQELQKQLEEQRKKDGR